MGIKMIGQILGIVALIFSAGSYQMKSQKSIVMFQIFATLSFTFHFAMIGAVSGAASNLIALSRNIIFYLRYKYSWAQKKVWLYIYIALFIFSGIYTYNGIISVIPTIAIIISTLAFYTQDPQGTRKKILVSSPMWLVYDLLNQSYAGMFNESLVIISNITAYIRYAKKNTNANNLEA